MHTNGIRTNPQHAFYSFYVNFFIIDRYVVCIRACMCVHACVGTDVCMYTCVCLCLQCGVLRLTYFMSHFLCVPQCISKHDPLLSCFGLFNYARMPCLCLCRTIFASLWYTCVGLSLGSLVCSVIRLYFLSDRFASVTVARSKRWELSVFAFIQHFS